MKKMMIAANTMLLACLMGCSEPPQSETPSQMMAAARASMPKDANVLLVSRQMPNINYDAMMKAWGSDPATKDAQIEAFKALLPAPALKAMEALGLKLGEPLQGEAVAAIGATIKDINPDAPDVNLGAYLNTGTLDYTSLLTLVKDAATEAQIPLTSEDKWTTAPIEEGAEGAIGMQERDGGIQFYASTKAQNFSTIEPYGDDTFMSRAFATLPGADYSFVLCVKDINTFAVRSGITENPQAALLKDIKTGYLALVGNTTEAELKAEIDTTTPEVAQQVSQAVIGFRMMANMGLEMSASAMKVDLSNTVQAINAITITPKETKVTITTKVTPAQMKAISAEIEALNAAQMKQMEEIQKKYEAYPLEENDSSFEERDFSTEF